jgi:hypothetical protein
MRILCSLILLWVCNHSFAQQELPIHRKVSRIENAYKDVVKLCETDPFFRDETLPEIIGSKTALALHFPGTIPDFRLKAEDRGALENWIVNYPSEHQQYVEFLEKTIRKNR